MKKLVVLLGWLGLSSLTYAQTDLLSLYQRALDADTTLASTQNSEKIAQAQVDQGLARLLPNVTGSVAYSADSRGASDTLDIQFDDATTTYGVTVSQPLFYMNALHYYDAFKERAVGSQLNTEAAKQNLMVQVADAYFKVLKAQDNLQLVEKEVEAVQRQLDQTEQRYQVGLAAMTDVLDARATFDSTRVNRINAESQYHNALQSLATLMGQAPESLKPFPEQINLPAHNTERNADAWVKQALTEHPSVLAQVQNTLYAEKSYQAKKAEVLPTVDASFQYQESDQDASSYSALSIRVSVPIYSGGQKKAERLESGLNHNSALQQLEQVRRNTELNVRTMYRLVETNLANIDAQKQLLTSRESALRATQVGYEVGTRNIVEVLNAQRALFAARLQYRTAHYDYLLNSLKLKQAAGAITQQDLEALNALLAQ